MPFYTFLKLFYKGQLEFVKGITWKQLFFKPIFNEIFIVLYFNGSLKGFIQTNLNFRIFKTILIISFMFNSFFDLKGLPT